MKRNIKREEIYNRLLEVGLSLFNKQGYHGTGIKFVTEEAELPKGSFYTYFDSKEAFGGAVVDDFTRQGLKYFQAVMKESKNPLVGLKTFFENSRDKMVETDFVGGCLLGNFSNELGSEACNITPHLIKGLENISSNIAEVLAKAQENGLVRTDLSAKILGDLLLNGWEGALMRAKTQRSTFALDQFLNAYFEILLKS